MSGLRVYAGGRVDTGAVRLAVVRGAVDGRPRLIDGASPAGATVMLVPTDSSKQAFSTAAGPSGDYRVDGVPEGEYVVRAAHLEYAPGYTDSQQVDGEGRTTFAELTLQPASAVVRAEVDGQIGARYSKSLDVRVLLFAFGDHVRELKLSEDPAFASEALGDVDWRQYAASVDVVLSADDGEKTLYARFRDRWGPESPVFSTSLTLDRTSPVITSATVGTAVAGGARSLPQVLCPSKPATRCRASPRSSCRPTARSTPRRSRRFVRRGVWFNGWLDGPHEVSANQSLRENTILADAAGQTFIYLDAADEFQFDLHLEGIDLDRRMSAPLTVGSFVEVSRADNSVAVDPRGRLVIHGHCDSYVCGGRLVRATSRANE